MQVLPSATSSVTCYSDDSSCGNHIIFANGNFGKMTVTDSNVIMAKYNEDAGTLVVSNFVYDAWQHGEDFVAACM